MRQLIAVIAALTLFAVGAQAQGNYRSTGLLSSTATVTAAATTNYATAAYTIDTTKWDELGLTLSFKLGAATANSSNVVVTFSKSTDNVKWTTVGDFVWTVAANSTNEVVAYTNLDMETVGYLRLDSINNQNTNAMTNIVLRYTVKPKGRG